jgi:hypothetical protein
MLACYPVILSAAAMTAHASYAGAGAKTIRCRATAMQNACVGQEICIDDPRGLARDLTLSLLMEKREYASDAKSGEIISADVTSQSGLSLIIYPAIEGGNRLEIGADLKAAKLVGGSSNHVFRCHHILFR